MSELWTCQTCGLINDDIHQTGQCDACGSSREQELKGTVTLEKITCAGCDAPVDVASGVGRGQVVCGHCGSIVDLSSPEHKILSKYVGDKHPPRSAIRLGLEGNFNGVAHRVVGRIRYVSAEGWPWDEWFLVAADGSIAYLEEDEGEYCLMQPFTPKQPPDMEAIKSGANVAIDGVDYRVWERSAAKVAYFEGQLPWKVEVDTEVDFADLASPSGSVSVEWTKRELEFYVGHDMSSSAVQHALRLADYSMGQHSGSDSAEPSIGSVVSILGFILLFAAAPLFCGDGCDGGGGGYYGGGGGHYSGGGGFGK